MNLELFRWIISYRMVDFPHDAISFQMEMAYQVVTLQYLTSITT